MDVMSFSKLTFETGVSLDPKRRESLRNSPGFSTDQIIPKNEGSLYSSVVFSLDETVRLRFCHPLMVPRKGSLYSEFFCLSLLPCHSEFNPEYKFSPNKS